MTPQEMDKWIFQNPIGFYALMREGKMYLRDVRDKELYRSEDRKRIPQGKECVFFRTGDLLAIFLKIGRFKGHATLRSDEFLMDPGLVKQDAITRVENMDRTMLVNALTQSDSFSQFRQNFTEPNFMDTITDEELRRLLLFMTLKRSTAACQLLHRYFVQLDLFRP
jgi:hypothetical protein